MSVARPQPNAHNKQSTNVAKHHLAPSRLERLQGCLFGGAIGDALGSPVEFLSRGEIQARYGHQGVADYPKSEGSCGQFSDETQLTLWTMEGLCSWRNAQIQTQASLVKHVHRAYRSWLSTQLPSKNDTSLRWLATHPCMQEQRSPNLTSVSILERDLTECHPDKLSNRDGGALARSAPFGLAFSNPFQIALNAASTTHAHPDGYLSAGTYASLLAKICEGHSLLESLSLVLEQLVLWPEHEPVAQALLSALSWSSSPVPAHDVIEELAVETHAEGLLSIAVFCALRAETDFLQGLRWSVNHSTETDITGTLTGQILGAHLGFQHLPSTHLFHLDDQSLLHQMSTDFYHSFHTDKPPNPSRYPATLDGL